MSRWIALLVSSAVSLIALWIFLQTRNAGGEDVTLVESDVEGALAEREASAKVPSDPVLLESEPWLAYPFHVPLEAALKLYPQLKSRVRRWDPWCIYVYKPHIVTGKAFAEHPDGRYEKRANSLGIRSEREPREVKPQLRILVAGDSHVDGICYPSEGYPALLEGRLTRAMGEENVEVMNAAHGGYNIYHYVGTLERFLHLDLQPDLFVMTVFAGNDLSELLSPTRYFSKTKEKYPMNARYKQHRDSVRSAEGRMKSAFAQGLNGTGLLASWPQKIDDMLAIALDLTGRVKARCDERGIELLVVLLPTPVELLDHTDRELVERTMEHAGIVPEDIDRMKDLRERYVGALPESGIASLDLYPAFAEHEGPLYWSQDLHINLAAHQLTAALVEAEVLRIMEISSTGK